MVSKRVIIKNPSGLHLRPASYFVNTTDKLESDIIIKIADGTRINGKSIINIMAAGIKNGAEIDIICEGETEENDLKIMIEAIEGGLGE